MSRFLDSKVFQQRDKELESLVHCPECKYYYAPVCTFYKFLPMTSRRGYCYHGIKGTYKGGVPIVQNDTIVGFEKYMNPPEEENNND